MSNKLQQQLKAVKRYNDNQAKKAPKVVSQPKPAQTYTSRIAGVHQDFNAVKAQQQAEMSQLLAPPKQNPINLFQQNTAQRQNPFTDAMNRVAKQQQPKVKTQDESLQEKVESGWNKVTSFIKDIPSLSKYAVQHPKDVAKEIEPTIRKTASKSLDLTGLGDETRTLGGVIGEGAVAGMNKVQDMLTSPGEKKVTPDFNEKNYPYLFKTKPSDVIKDTGSASVKAAVLKYVPKQISAPLFQRFGTGAVQGALWSIADAVKDNKSIDELKQDVKDQGLIWGAVEGLMPYATGVLGAMFGKGTKGLVETATKDVEQVKGTVQKISETSKESTMKGSARNPLAKDEPKPTDKPQIKSAVIQIGDSTYSAESHAAALEKAQKAGEDISKIDKQKDGMFKTSDGRTITRKQAEKEFGVKNSHEVPELKKVQDSKPTPKIDQNVKETPKQLAKEQLTLQNEALQKDLEKNKSAIGNLVNKKLATIDDTAKIDETIAKLKKGESITTAERQHASELIQHAKTSELPKAKLAEVKPFDADKVNRQIDHIVQAKKDKGILAEARAAQEVKFPPKQTIYIKQTPALEDAQKVFSKATIDKPSKGKNLVGAVKDLFDPVHSVKEGTDIKTAFREHAATFRFNSDVSAGNSLERSKFWDKVSSEDHLNFIHSVETGTPIKGDQTLFNEYKKKFAQDFDIMKTIDEKSPYRRDYFTHNGLWSDPKAASDFFNKWQTEKFGGKKAFFKAREFPTVYDGLKAGLKIKETNPEKLYLANHINVLKAKMADDFTKEMASSGMPQDAVQAVINRYMDRGIKDNAIYQTMRTANSSLNQFQLGLSAFHFSTTSMNSIVSRLGLGIKEVSQGKILKGLGTAATSPAAVFIDAIKGNKVLKAAFSDNPELTQEIKTVLEAGGNLHSSQVYKSGAWDKMTENFRKGEYVKGALRSPVAAIDKAAAPLMEWFVPRLKVGSFLETAANELERMGPNVTKSERRAVLAKAWDSTDNRFGQLVQDNLMWSQTLKDSLNVSTRSLGWNLGTIRELGGGAVDLGNVPKLINRLKKGEGISDRSSYLLALPVVTASIALMYSKLHGTSVTGAKDLAYPKTGETTKAGYPERVSIPGYMKDVVSYEKAPAQTILNKQSPLFTIMSKMGEFSLTGGVKDYFGNWVVDPNASAQDKALQFAQFAANQITPFSVSAGQNRVNKDATSKAEGFFGFVPASAAVTKGDAATSLSKTWQEMMPNPPKTPAEAQALQDKLNALPGKTARSDEEINAELNLLQSLKQAKPNSQERTQLLQNYMLSLKDDASRKSIAYKLQLAGISTKGVSSSGQVLKGMPVYDDIMTLYKTDKNAAIDKYNALSTEDKANFDKAKKSAVSSQTRDYKTANSQAIKDIAATYKTDKSKAIDMINAIPPEQQKAVIAGIKAELKKPTDTATTPADDVQASASVKGFHPTEKGFLTKAFNFISNVASSPADAIGAITSGNKINKLKDGTVIVTRMDQAVSNQIKSQMVKDTGGKAQDYQLDHTIPLELGGTNNKDNLKLIPVAKAKEADQLENVLGDALGNGDLSKGDAQSIMLDFKNDKITLEEALTKVNQ